MKHMTKRKIKKQCALLRDKPIEIPRCPNCGLNEAHWISTAGTFIQLGKEPGGFWTCPKYYDADGRRIK